jgi:hypothetical protein
MITFSVISRSIYYYLIARFSKKRIRIVYAVAGLLALFIYLTEYDQYQYYAGNHDDLVISSNKYDNLRQEGQFIVGASIPSNQVSGTYMQLFIRYDARDNEKIKGNCPDFVPLKKDGLNWRFSFTPTEGGLRLSRNDFNDEDKEQVQKCLSSLYQVSVNDSVCHDLKFFFFTHPAKSQKGLITMFGTQTFRKGENKLVIKKVYLNKEGERQEEDFTKIPFWFY